MNVDQAEVAVFDADGTRLSDWEPVDLNIVGPGEAHTCICYPQVRRTGTATNVRFRYGWIELTTQLNPAEHIEADTVVSIHPFPVLVGRTMKETP